MSTILTWQFHIHHFVIRSTIWFGRMAEFLVLNTWKDHWYPLSVLFVVILGYYHFYTVVNCPLPGQDLCGFLTIYLLNDNLLSPRMLFIPCSRCTGPSFDKVVVNTLPAGGWGRALCLPPDGPSSTSLSLMGTHGQSLRGEVRMGLRVQETGEKKKAVMGQPACQWQCTLGCTLVSSLRYWLCWHPRV